MTCISIATKTTSVRLGWNRWYTPKGWALGARSACDDISRLKTAMIVENLWKHLKRRDLSQFSRSRLDLITHLATSNLLPRAQQMIVLVAGKLRNGRAKALAP